MNKNPVLSYLESHHCADEISAVIDEAKKIFSHSGSLISNDSARNLSADHYVKIYRRRLANAMLPEVTVRSLSETLRSIERIDGLLHLIVAQSEDNWTAMILSASEDLIVGCVLAKN